MKKALFLDRDGVINEEVNYAYKIEQIKFMPGIFDLAKAALDKDYIIIVVTNQAGIGRGYYTEDDFNLLTEWIEGQFTKNSTYISRTYFSPNHPEHGIGKYKIDCEDRKPKAGMLFKAAKDFQINLSSSLIIGDRETDIQAGKNAGLKKTILFTEDESVVTKADYKISALTDAINLL